MSLTEKDALRFVAKVDMSGGPLACWPWRGTLRGANKARPKGGASPGRGAFHLGGRKVYAHRVAFAIVEGRYPDGLLRHECDNPVCCNPGHITEGTHGQNLQDAYDRGRRVNQSSAPRHG
jgi:hypothetical protein